MYLLSTEQIEYILADFNANGIEDKVVQKDLLDCIASKLNEKINSGTEFEQAFKKVSASFYNNRSLSLRQKDEAIEHTRNYYTLQQSLIYSGGISLALLALGMVLSTFHLAGRSLVFLASIFIFSFIFLPLLFIYKSKLSKNKLEKSLAIIGTILGLLFSTSVYFIFFKPSLAQPLSMIMLSFALLVFMPLNIIYAFKSPIHKTKVIINCILILFFMGFFYTSTSKTNKADLRTDWKAQAKTNEIVLQKVVRQYPYLEMQSAEKKSLWQSLNQFKVHVEMRQRQDLEHNQHNLDWYTAETMGYISQLRNKVVAFNIIEVYPIEDVHIKNTFLDPNYFFNETTVHKVLAEISQLQILLLLTD